MAAAKNKTPKKNKYEYLKVIQQNYGQGFEDVSDYEANSKGEALEMSGKFKELKRGGKREMSLLEYDLGEYTYKSPYATKVVFRKRIAK